MATLPEKDKSLANRESIQFRWNALADVLDVLQAGGLLDFVFFPWIDSQLDRDVTCTSMPRQLKVPWGALLLAAGDFSSPPKGYLRRRRRLKRYQSLQHPELTQLVTLDELAIDQLSATFPSSDVRWMPDLMEPNPRCEGTTKALDSARAAGLPILLSTGVMHRRKGYLKLLEIAARGQVKNWFFLLAGKIVHEELNQQEARLVRDATEGRLDNLALADQHLPTPLLNTHVKQADAIFLGYEQWNQSSNIMTRASHFQRPIFSCPDGILAHRTREDKLGMVLPDLEIDTIQTILAATTSEQLHQLRLAAGFDRYVDRHSCTALDRTFEKVLGIDGPSGRSAA
jgi:hypothetical protein